MKNVPLDFNKNYKECKHSKRFTSVVRVEGKDYEKDGCEDCGKEFKKLRSISLKRR